MDEIWTLGNETPRRPFTVNNRTLERYDPLTGERTGSWHFPAENTARCNMSESYRYTLACGYVHESPVLVTAQGTYGDMALQGWDPGMEKRWETFIPADEPGARASHVYPILDFNNDGIDELFWGERVLSFDDGAEVICYDRQRYHAHSDIVTPFVDPESDRLYIYTCREKDVERTPERVAVFDALSGEAMWRWPHGGHMHNGWLASYFDGGRRLAYAMSLAIGASGGDVHRSEPIHYYFDAVSGEPLKNPLPFEGHKVSPVDVNGDGYHEFLHRSGKIYDRHGKIIADIEGSARVGKKLDLPGHQVEVSRGEEGVVLIFGDDEAGDGGDRFKDYHLHMRHVMASGYNPQAYVTCGM